MITKTAVARETEADVSSYLGALNTAMKELSAIRKANKTTDAEIRRLRTSTRKKLGRIRENLDRMLKQLVEYILDLLNTARDTRANKEAIAEVRQEVDELAGAVERLSFELRSLREDERHEREKLMLRLENALLRLEKQLPPAMGSKKLK